MSAGQSTRWIFSKLEKNSTKLKTVESDRPNRLSCF